MTHGEIFGLSLVAMVVGAALITLDHGDAGSMCLAAALAGIGSGAWMKRAAAKKDQEQGQ